MSKKKLIKRCKWGARVNKFLAGGDSNNDEYPLLKSKFLRSTEENPITVNFDLELFKYPEDVNDSNFKKINVDDLSRSYIMSDLRVLKNDDEYYTIAYDSEGNPVKIYDLKDNNIVPKGYHKHDNKALENSYIEARKKLDYIGDSDAEKARFLNKTESIVNAVDSLSNVYGINKDIFLERLIHEGFIDNLIHDYNYNYNLEQQNNIKDYSLYTPVKAFHHLGLDTAGEHLERGDYNLRWVDPNLGFWSEDNTNEKGTTTHSVGVPNLASGLEIKAAHIEYLTNLMKQRYPNASKQELNALINAAYNIGENHKDLNNKEWVNKNYEVVPWSELIDKKKTQK